MVAQLQETFAVNKLMRTKDTLKLSLERRTLMFKLLSFDSDNLLVLKFSQP